MKQKLLLLIPVLFLLALPMSFSYVFNDGTSSGNISFRDVNTTVKYINITMTGVNFTTATITMTGFVNLTQNRTFSNLNSDGIITWNGSDYFQVNTRISNDLASFKNLSVIEVSNPALYIDEWNFSWINPSSDDDMIIFNKSELYFFDYDLKILNRTNFPNHDIDDIKGWKLPSDVEAVGFKNGELWSCTSPSLLRRHDNDDFSIVVENHTFDFTFASCKGLIYDGTSIWLSGTSATKQVIRLNKDNYNLTDYISPDSRFRIFYDNNDIHVMSRGVDVIKYFGRGFPIDLTINVGNDSTVEYTSLIENTKNITTIDLATGFNDYMADNCVGQTICTIPIIFNSTAGMWAYSNLVFGYDTLINITFYDEVTDAKLIINITFDVVGDFFANNYTIDNDSISLENLPLGNYRITYNAEKYTKRDYYFTLVNGTTNLLDLYLLSTTNGTDVIFTVQDNSGNALVAATIYLKRYYVSTNSYKTVAMIRTNEEGDALIDVDFNDAYYQILVNYNGFSLQTIGTRIISTIRILTMDLIPSPFGIVDAIAGVTTSLTFNTATQTFSYVFTDISGVSRTGTLDVIKTTPTSATKVCTNTETSVSGTVLCQYNTTKYPGTYTAKGYISINPKLLTDTFQIFSGIKRDFKNIFGTQGIFFTILIAGALGGLGAAISPAVGMIMFMVGIVFASFMGMSIMSMVFISFLIIAMVVIIFRMKR